MGTRARAGLVLLLVIGLLGWPGVTGAEEPRTFGTTSAVSHTLGAFAFAAADAASSAAAGATVTGTRFCSGAPCSFRTSLMLPAGASVVGFELAACDTSPSANVTAVLTRHADPDGGLTAVSIVSTGDAATPGCGFFNGSIPVPETIENFNNSYLVAVGTSGTDLSTRFAAVRVRYRLQVSPAPATATFGDVPLGHPFRPFVEALFAAGITSGCSVAPPLYCPDNPVTRAQMAAFISKALGLHWVP